MKTAALPLGLGLGVVFGILSGNLALGIGLGLAIGGGAFAFFSARDQKYGDEG